MKKFLLILFILTAFSFKNSNENNPIIVLVKYKTLTEKSYETISYLTLLLEKVKEEKHFVKISMLVDPKDNTNILLYEEWDDETYYKNEHMNTEHIQKFIMDSRNFLAGPPEISFWKLEKAY